MHTQTRHDTQKITQFDSNSSTRNVFHGSEYQFAAWKLFVLCALFHDLVNHHQFVKHTSQKKAYVSILYMCVNWNRLFWLEWERETHSPRRTFFFFLFCAYFIFAMWILWVLSVIAFFLMHTLWKVFFTFEWSTTKDPLWWVPRRIHLDLVPSDTMSYAWKIAFIESSRYIIQLTQ